MKDLTAIGILALLLLVACTYDGEAPGLPDEEKNIMPQNPNEEQPQLTVLIDEIKLRNAPNVKGTEVARLAEGSTVYDLGEQSDHTTTITLRGDTLTTTWLRVATPGGDEGWIYGGGVRYNDPNTRSNYQRDMRYRSYRALLGDDFYNAATRLNKRAERVRDEASFIDFYEATQNFQDNVGLAEDRFSPNPYNAQQQELPADFPKGFVAGLYLGSAAEGTVYYFYHNYAELGRLARLTSSPYDDQFVEVLVQESDDTISTFYPVYFMQTWDYGGYSRLGGGKHYELLQAVSRLHRETTAFDKHLEDIKEPLLQDILSSSEGYWYDRPKVLAEIDRILANERLWLDPEERELLQMRRENIADTNNSEPFNLRTAVPGLE